MPCTLVHISNSWWLYQCAYNRPTIVCSEHRCTSAGRLTSVCNGLINTRHSGPRWIVIGLSLGCRRLPRASDRLGCVATESPVSGYSGRHWTGALRLRIGGHTVTSAPIFVACTGTVCLVLIISFRCVISSLFWKCLLLVHLYRSIFQFTLWLKTFVHFTAWYFCFSITAQYLCSVIPLNTSVHFMAQEFCSLVLPNTFVSVSLLNTFVQLYRSIFQFTLRFKSFVQLYCLILLVQLYCSVPLFSYTAQYFSLLHGSRILFTYTA